MFLYKPRSPSAQSVPLHIDLICCEDCMFAAHDHQLDASRSFWGSIPDGFLRPGFDRLDIATLRCAIMGDACGTRGHFRAKPTTQRALNLGGKHFAPHEAPDSETTTSLIDQLLLSEKSQRFAASGDWHQNSSLTVKTNGDTYGQT